MRGRRLWPVAATLVVLTPLIVAGAFVVHEIRAMGQGIGEAMGAAFEGIGAALGPQIRAMLGDAPDLEVAPATPGYHDSLGTVGPQGHYYGKKIGRTTIGGEISLGGSLIRLPVAEYDGPPSREVPPERLRPLEFPVSVARVRVIDGAGRHRGRVGVSWTRAEGTGHGTAWGDAGEVELILFGPGAYALGIEGEGEPSHAITLAAGEGVWCSLGPSGLAIDRREKR